MLQNVTCMETCNSQTVSGTEVQGKLQYDNILHVCILIFLKLLLLQVTQNNFQLTWFCVIFCNKSLSNKVMS